MRRSATNALDIDETCIMCSRIAARAANPGMAEVGNMGLPPKVLKKGITDMIRISDARMSGTAYGTVILHTSPEAGHRRPAGHRAHGRHDRGRRGCAPAASRPPPPPPPPPPVAEDEIAARLAAWRPAPPPTPGGAPPPGGGGGGGGGGGVSPPPPAPTPGG